jgi:MAE_28990/MAE_18760-like HEPN
MTDLHVTLVERRQEFDGHLAFAVALDRRLIEGDAISIGEMALSVRHLLTIKSGLIVHLYNVVEATMTKVIDEIGKEVLAVPPSQWSHITVKEWLRRHAAIGVDGNEDTRLEVVHGAALRLLAREPIENPKFKKPSGTWSDKVILKFAQRLGVSFQLNGQIAPRMQPSPQYRDMSPLAFLADRRNAIAHGRRTFENGANDLTLPQIAELASVTLDYLALAVTAFESYIDQKQFRTADA